MTQPLYSLHEVQHRYGTRTVLNVPALHIHRGEVLALVGPSGAGKSTLLRLLAMLEAPTAGKVNLYLGQAPVSYHSASITDRRQIAMVFQRPSLLSRNVWRNVAYGLRLRGERNGHQRVARILERVAMQHLADAHPRTLSGGEMQRVSIARALVLDPQVLLLDEPTANLDRHNVRLIEDLIQDQRRQSDATIVLVTHHIFQARRLADRVAFLLDGNLVEIAPTDTFFDRPQDPRTAQFLSGDLVY